MAVRGPGNGGFGVRVDTRPFQQAMRDIDRIGSRAAQWSVREGARKVKRAAQKIAPVYTGHARRVQVNVGDGYRLIPLVPGEYKASIASSKQLRQVAVRSWAVRVGPRGGHVHLYAQKIEDRDHVMHRAYEEVAPQVGEIFDGAMRRALRKYGR